MTEPNSAEMEMSLLRFIELHIPFQLVRLFNLEFEGYDDILESLRPEHRDSKY